MRRLTQVVSSTGARVAGADTPLVTALVARVDTLVTEKCRRGRSLCTCVGMGGKNNRPVIKYSCGGGGV